MKNPLLLIVLLLCSASLALAEPAAESESQPQPTISNPSTPGEWRATETFGIGVLAGWEWGMFVDYNLSPSEQIHFQTSCASVVRSNIFGGTILDTGRCLKGASYRMLPWAERGIYFGAGAGTISTESFYFGEKIANGRGVYAFGEAGWQGHNGYYFHIGIQPGVNLTYSDDFDETNIQNDYYQADHRSTAKGDWAALSNPNTISMGFGWFF